MPGSTDCHGVHQPAPELTCQRFIAQLRVLHDPFGPGPMQDRFARLPKLSGRQPPGSQGERLRRSFPAVFPEDIKA